MSDFHGTKSRIASENMMMNKLQLTNISLVEDLKLKLANPL